MVRKRCLLPGALGMNSVRARSGRVFYLHKKPVQKPKKEKVM